MFMLMHELGEGQFWAAIHNYLQENQFKNATTEIFFDSVSKSTGKDLDEFRKQWFYTPAAPSLTARRDGDGIVIDQGRTHFHLPLDYWLIDPDGTIEKSHIDLPASGHTDIPDSKGKLILLDPEVWIMADISYEMNYTDDELMKLYRLAPNAGQKERLMPMLNKLSVSQKVSLARFEHSTRVLQTMLPEIPDRDLLLDMSSNSDPRVVEAALQGMATLEKSKAVTDRCQALLDHGANQVVQEAAFQALLKFAPDGTLAHKGLTMDSFNEGFRVDSLHWIANHIPDEGRTLALSALKNPATTEPVRIAAIGILGQVKDKVGEKSAYNELIEIVSEHSISPLRAAINALAQYGDKAAIRALRKRADHSLHYVRSDVRRALNALGEH
jgi:aminopeptidase N